VATMRLLYIEQQKTHNTLQTTRTASIPADALPLGRGINYSQVEKEGPSTAAATMTIIMDV
jgi:hypothetical protein